jgi:hypothetical protein
MKGNPNPDQSNLRPFKKGHDDRRNTKGQPRKLPELDKLLADCFGSDEMEKVLKAVYAKALKGDTRAAEIILERGYGKAKQEVQNTGVSVIKVIRE